MAESHSKHTLKCQLGDRWACFCHGRYLPLPLISTDWICFAPHLNIILILFGCVVLVYVAADSTYQTTTITYFPSFPLHSNCIALSKNINSYYFIQMMRVLFSRMTLYSHISLILVRFHVDRFSTLQCWYSHCNLLLPFRIGWTASVWNKKQLTFSKKKAKTKTKNIYCFGTVDVSMSCLFQDVGQIGLCFHVWISVYALIQWAHECTKQNPTKIFLFSFHCLSHSRFSPLSPPLPLSLSAALRLFFTVGHMGHSKM